jgi:hypothetical protein
VVPWCKKGGIKALRAAAEVHSLSPAAGTTGGPVGALASAGACGSASPGASGARSQMMASASGARPSGEWRGTRTPMCLVAARRVAPAHGSAPWRRARFKNLKCPHLKT